MTIELPADVQPIIHQAIASGRGTDEVDVVRQALRVYDQLERRRQSLRREIDKGVASGDSIPGEIVFQQLEQLAGPLGAGADETAP
jgi:putative addiction module CopG family antidote